MKFKFVFLFVFLLLPLYILAQIDISVPKEVKGKIGKTIGIPISVSELKSQEITAFEMALNYQDSLEIVDYKLTKITKILNTVDMNHLKNSKTIIAGYGAKILAGKGKFVIIKIKLHKKGICRLYINDFYLNSTQYLINPVRIIVK